MSVLDLDKDETAKLNADITEIFLYFKEQDFGDGTKVKKDEWQ